MNKSWLLLAPLALALGLAGGGEGRCQLSESSREINAEFPRQS